MPHPSPISPTWFRCFPPTSTSTKYRRRKSRSAHSSPSACARAIRPCSWPGMPRREALGFVQLYPLFASLALRPSWLLSDLYVRPEVRRQGVGEALMNQARGFAESMGACGLQLETAKTNHAGQSLYERLGYVRDEQFYTYWLQL
ncbi:N-acetyltransferase [Pseudomonas aeruginosa]|nr:N-acetyltransferase [Pseudomonas aeruginosa]